VLQTLFAFILRLIAFVGALWILRRFLAPLFSGGYRTARRPPGNDQRPTGKMVKDPVCGMYMDPRLALRLDRREDPVFFCSEECRRQFVDGGEAQPGT